MSGICYGNVKIPESFQVIYINNMLMNSNVQQQEIFANYISRQNIRETGFNLRICKYLTKVNKKFCEIVAIQMKYRCKYK